MIWKRSSHCTKIIVFLLLLVSISSSKSSLSSNITLSLTNLKHDSVKVTWSPSSDNQCSFNRLQHRVDVDARENTFAWLDYPITFSTILKHATPDIQTITTLVDNDSIIDSGFFQLKLDVVPDPRKSKSKPYNKLESMTLSKELGYNASATDIEDGIRQISGVKRVRVFRHAIGKFGRSDMDLNGAFSWRIELEVSSGNVPLLQVQKETLGGLYSNDNFKRIDIKRNYVGNPVEYVTEFHAVIDHLEAETSYEIRVVEDECQERNANESEIQHIKTLPLPIELDSDERGTTLPALDQTQNRHCQILLGNGRQIGKMDDVDYIHGYGFGGLQNSNGHDGLVVIRSYENENSMSPTIQTFYHSVLPQHFTFPMSLHASPFIDVKLWGAGSAGIIKRNDTGNVFSDGIGSDFVQARLAGKPNEIFIVHVGKGGTFDVEENNLNKGGTSAITSSDGTILVKAKGGCFNCEYDSSFINLAAVYNEEDDLTMRLPPLVVENVYHDSIKLSWNPNILSTLMMDEIVHYNIEVSESHDNQECTEDFLIIKFGSFESKKRENHLASGLETNSSYCFRLLAFTDDYVQRKSSEVVVVKTLEYPTNKWWTFAPRRGFDEVEKDSSPPTACELEHYPSPRRGASLAHTNGKVYLFGGQAKTCVCRYVIETYSNECKKEVVWSNELWELDTLTNIWKLLLSPQFSMESPSGREQHSFTVLANGKIALIGGRNEDTIFGDTWILDVENTLSWTRLIDNCDNEEAKDREIVCKGITPRYSHMAIAVNNDVYVFGGMNDGPCLDGWRFDFESKQQWIKLNTEGTTRVSFQRHLASLTPYGIVTRKELQDSMSNNVAMSYSMILYDVITEEYRSLNVDEIIPSSESGPMERSLEAFTYIGKNHLIFKAELLQDRKNYRELIHPALLMYGGDYISSHDILLNDQWLLTLEQLELNMEHIADARQKVCHKILNPSKTGNNEFDWSCGALADSYTFSPCKWQDVVLVAWCNEQYNSFVSPF